jgi:hypothetical protein
MATQAAAKLRAATDVAATSAAAAVAAAVAAGVSAPDATTSPPLSSSSSAKDSKEYVCDEHLLDLPALAARYDTRINEDTPGKVPSQSSAARRLLFAPVRSRVAAARRRRTTG